MIRKGIRGLPLREKPSGLDVLLSEGFMGYALLP